MSDEKRQLSAHEIAALTARVPCSGTPAIDSIITLSLRYHTAMEFMAAMLKRETTEFTYKEMATLAMLASNALINQFQEGTHAEKTQT